MRVRPVLLKKDEYDRFKIICVDEPAFFEIFFFWASGKIGGKNFFFGFSEGKKKKISKNFKKCGFAQYFEKR